MDLVGPGSTLITASDAPVRQRQADAAGAAGIPVTVRRLNDGRLREEHPGSFHRLCAMPMAGAVLVRPDGHIAWRTPSPAAGRTSFGSSGASSPAPRSPPRRAPGAFMMR
ncbi:hypothetical protein ABWJ92_36555 [Streptomyces sp. NPDC000609]|uniref:aromatic-ring hydroxylase C-terminal domain-containing protein n=1 Tax=Streptomyces sp. NPDC000609 TaxID=3160957 RepID=UPI0033974485